MAFTFGFYNALNHDRRYNAIQVSSIFDGIVRDGVFMSIGGHMNVQATNNGFNIVVESGRAWFNHTWSLLDADYPMVVEPSDVLEDRIDAVVLEVNENVDVRLNSIKIIKGEPAAKPAKPALTNNLDVHQYPLAYITVPANSVTLTQSNVENAVGTSATPFVTGILETIDIDDLIAQWKSQWNDWTEEVDLNWNNWFETVNNAWTTWFNQSQSDWEDTLQERTEEWEEIKDTVDSEWASQQGSINSDYTNWKQTALASYNQWLEQIQGTLDDDAATQLASEIVELQNRDDVISTYQHVKTGTQHMFLGSGSNGKVKMRADVASGDTVVVSSAPKNKITVQGETSQPGTGDPSPKNIRMIDGVGMYDKCIVLDGSSDETWEGDRNGKLFRLRRIQNETINYVVQSNDNAVCNALSNSLKAGSVNDVYYNRNLGVFTFPIASDQYGHVFICVDLDTVKELRSYLQSHPLIIWYRSVDFYKSKGPFYYVHEVSDGTTSPYKAIGIELNAPLFDGDSLKVSSKSGFDRMVVLDGSESLAKIVPSDPNRWDYRVLNVGHDAVSVMSDYLPGYIDRLVIKEKNTPGICIPGYDVDTFAINLGVFLSENSAAACKSYLSAHPLVVFYKSVNYTPENDIAVALEKHTRNYLILDGTEVVTVATSGDNAPHLKIMGAADNHDSSHRLVSSVAPFAYAYGGAGAFADSGNIVFGKAWCQSNGFANTATMAKDFKSFLTAQHTAGTPVQVVYELAASATYAHPIQPEALPAYYGTEDFVTALAGEPVTGKWLSFTNDGTQLNFKGGGGIGVSKLAATTALPADVVSGKTFYSKDKTLKTGTIIDRAALTDAVNVGNDGNYLYARIPQGAYRTNQATGYPEIRIPNSSAIANIPGGDNGAWNGTYSGSNVTIPQGYHNGGGSVGVAGGNRGAWGTTINPGGSVTIPQGYHSGGGVVRANGGGSWPLRHMGFNGSNQLETYSVGAPDGEGTYVWVFEGIVSWGNANSGLEFHFFENNFGPVYGERNNHITSGKNYFTSGTTVQVRYWGGFADLWYIRIA